MRNHIKYDIFRKNDDMIVTLRVFRRWTHTHTLVVWTRMCWGARVTWLRVDQSQTSVTWPLPCTRWCPRSLAKLVPITPKTLVYGWYIYIYIHISIYSIHGVYNPTNITGGAPPCAFFLLARGQIVLFTHPTALISAEPELGLKSIQAALVL